MSYSLSASNTIEPQLYRPKYYISSDSEEETALSDFRIRLFMRHSFLMSCLYPNNALMRDSQSQGETTLAMYNDWRIPGRPPVVGVKNGCFDEEIAIHFVDDTVISNSKRMKNNTDIWLRGVSSGPYAHSGELYYNQNDIENSYSYIPTGTVYHNPKNVLLEKFYKSVSISEIKTISTTDRISTVQVTTTVAHGFSTGMCITITGITTSEGNTDTSSHMFGHLPGQRFMGDFEISVTSSNSFTYTTSHIRNGDEVLTRENHPNMVAEVWKLIEYTDVIKQIGSDDSLIYVYLPFIYGETYDFSVGDYVSISDTVHYNVNNAKVASFDSETNLLSIVKPSNIDSNVTEMSGTLHYTPRLPSGNIPVNYNNANITSCPVYEHARRMLLIYADRDTYCDTNNPTMSYGSSNTLTAHYLSKYPVFHFNIPTFDVPDDDVKCEFALFETDINNSSNNAVLTIGLLNDHEFTSENAIASDIMANDNIDPTNKEVGTLSSYSFTNYVTYLVKQYNRFDIDSDIAKKMVAGNLLHSLYINVASPANCPSDFIYSSKESEEAWPYIVIGLGSDITYSTTLSLYDTYMYYLCSSIQYDGTDYSVTVYGIDNASSGVYVRSGNFFNVGDEIEVMHTVHFNTSSATITNVECEDGLYTIKFKYNSGTPVTYEHSESYAVIQNKTHVISSYQIGSGSIEDRSEILTDPEIESSDKHIFSNQFDIVHPATMSDLNVDVETENGVITNDLNPIIITDAIVDGDKFNYLNDGKEVIISGINLNKVSGIPYAIIGSEKLLNGYLDSGFSFPLTVNDDGTLSFIYGKSYGHAQIEVPVIGVRNVECGDGVVITQFKVGSDSVFNTGDVIALISTPIYAIHNAEKDYPSRFPSSTTSIGFNYGKNYSIVVEDDTANDCHWISLYAKYIDRYGIIPVSYDRYISISDSDVESINSICDDGSYPFKMYNGFTTLTVQDSNIDTLDYSNRLFLQLDEYGPIAYSEKDTYTVGEEFSIYVSDLVDVSIKGNIHAESETYLIGDGDNRAKKFTFKADSAGIKTYQFTDSNGNLCSINITIVEEDLFSSINLYTLKYLPDGTPVLTFEVRGTTGYLSNTESSSIEDAGFISLGSNGKYGKVTLISDISTAEDYDYFYFDVTITDIGDGQMHVYANTLNKNGKSSISDWFAPLIFSKDITCLSPGDVLTFDGVNLGNIEVNDVKYTFGVEDDTWFTLMNTYSDDLSKMQVKLSKSFVQTKQLYPTLTSSDGTTLIAWQNTESRAVNITITDKPTIAIQNKSVIIDVGSTWSEPNDIEAIDYLGNSILDTLTISGRVDTSSEGVCKLKYYAIDSCGHYTDEVIRTVYVTAGCPIYIKPEHDEYTLGEDITLMVDDEISGKDGGMFNQNYLNNSVILTDMDGNTIEGTIIKATPDRKSLTIQSPGILGSNIKVQVDTGYDNRGYESCYLTNACLVNIVPAGDEDVELKETMSNNSTNSIDSIFSNINYSAVYNKDLSYSTFSEVTDENSLIQNVYTILLTNLGERLYNDEFGSNLEGSIFSIIDDINGRGKILTECIKLIQKYENRVSVSLDNSYVNYDVDSNRIDICLYVKVPRGNAKKIELTFWNNK